MLYQDVLSKLNGRTSRKVANNTYLRVSWSEHPNKDPQLELVLHSTSILTWYPDGRIVLNSGGWRTPVTKARMNAWLPRNYRVWQTKREWRIYRYSLNSGAIETQMDFTDGMVIGKGFTE